MRYPEFREAEYSTTDIPVIKCIKRVFKIVINILAIVAFFAFSAYIVYIALAYALKDDLENIYLDSISMCASIITGLSAIISIFSLLDSECMRKYYDDLLLFENIYLNGKKLPKWEFLKRTGHIKTHHSQAIYYYITSACCKIYYGNLDSESTLITIPALEADLHLISCIRNMLLIYIYSPTYIDYIVNQQNKYINSPDKQQPVYFLPLLNHLCALHKNILFHKVLNRCIILCVLTILGVITAFFVLLASNF